MYFYFYSKTKQQGYQVDTWFLIMFQCKKKFIDKCSKSMTKKKIEIIRGKKGINNRNLPYSNKILWWAFRDVASTTVLTWKHYVFSIFIYFTRFCVTLWIFDIHAALFSYQLICLFLFKFIYCIKIFILLKTISQNTLLTLISTIVCVCFVFAIFSVSEQ